MISTNYMIDKKIIVNSNNDNLLHVKKLREIVYLESVGRKTKTYCCEGEEYLVKKCLTQIEEKLPDEKFFKIHKSIIINVDFLQGINVNAEKSVLLHDGIELKIAHRKYKDFIEFVKNKFDFW
ncbi:MAG: LytTR family transcriptional regulator [Bacteroidales bacterium]|nr:LytTR family transcriptional regulator [Bacteroidales bacterium]